MKNSNQQPVKSTNCTKCDREVRAFYMRDKDHYRVLCNSCDVDYIMQDLIINTILDKGLERSKTKKGDENGK